jgi:hypothetical protein
MILYVNGDSHSLGINLETKDTYAARVSHALELELINHATIGASNQRILRTTHEYLENNTSDLIIIGWSTWEREEWQDADRYYDVNSSGSDHLPKYLQEKYKIWVTQQDADTMDAKSRMWHEKIYQLHTDLCLRQIPHVFFNCMYNFFSIKQPLDWKNCYIGPYENERSFYWYLCNQGYKTDTWYHHGAQAHGAWADLLLDHLDRYEIL